MANHSQTRGASWAPWLRAIREGYNASMRGEPWPRDFNKNYEWGRMLAAELRELGDAPPTLDINMRVTKAWQQRIDRATAFTALLRQHFART